MLCQWSAGSAAGWGTVGVEATTAKAAEMVFFFRRFFLFFLFCVPALAALSAALLARSRATASGLVPYSEPAILPYSSRMR